MASTRNTEALSRRSDAAFERGMSALTPATCIAVGLIASVVLLGWLLGNDALIRLLPTSGNEVMLPNAAIGLLLLAVALWLMRRDPVQGGAGLWLARVLAVLTGAMGFITLWEYVFRVDLGIDLVLFGDQVHALMDGISGRPPREASACFLALSLSLLMLDARSPVLRRAAEWLSLLVGLVGLQAAIAHVYGEVALYAPRRLGQPLLIPLAPHTALCFVLLVLGVFAARRQRGLLGLTAGSDAGSFMVRRMLPAAFLAPFALGWLSVQAHRSGVHGPGFGLSLMVVAMMVLLTLLIGLNGRALRRADTERARVMETLAGRESLFRALFTSAGSGIALVDEQGRPLKTNRALQQMLGYSEEELAQLPFTTFTHADDLDKDWGLFQELLDGQREFYRIEKRFVRKDGRVIWGQLTASVARDAAGKPLFFIGMVEDITERKDAEDAQRRLTAILEATPDFVGIADANLRTRYVNRGGRELIGIGVDDPWDVMIPEYHPAWAAERILKEGIPTAIRDGVWTGDSALIGADGREIPVSQVILAHYDASGQLSYLSTVLRDISDRKQHENAQQFLLEASRIFSGSLEVGALVRSITRLLVPRWADFCLVDLLRDDGVVERSAVAHAEPAQQALADQLTLHAGGQQGRAGGSRGGAHGQAAAGPGDQRRVAPDPGAQPGAPGRAACAGAALADGGAAGGA